MDSRRYVKRIWRVPKDRGALEYFAALLTKALVKHGWPAKYQIEPLSDGFLILHVDGLDGLPPDMERAVEIAARVVARVYAVEILQHRNWVSLAREYRVGAGGHFVEVKTQLKGESP